MSLLREVATELLGMFLGDAVLTVAVLALVALTAILVETALLPPLAGGVLLFLGCVAILAVTVHRTSQRRPR